MHKKNYSKTFIIIFILMIIFLTGLTLTSSNLVKLKEGQISYNKNHDSILLSGEWEFYPNNLINTFKVDIDSIKKEYLNTPNQYFDKKIEFASYRAVINNVPDNYIFNIDSFDINYDHIVYINNEYFYSKGNNLLSKIKDLIDLPSKDSIENFLNNDKLFYNNTSNKIEIVIEILGNEDGIDNLDLSLIFVSKDTFIINKIIDTVLTLFILSFYLLLIIFQFSAISIKETNKNEVIIRLTLSLISLFLIVYILNDNPFLTYLISKLDNYTSINHLYISKIFLYLTTPTIILISNNFRKESKLPISEIILLGFSALFVIITIFISSNFFSKNILYFEIINLILFSTKIVLLITRYNSYKYANLILVSIILIALGLLHDLLLMAVNNSLFSFEINKLCYFLSTFLFISVSSQARDDVKKRIEEIKKLKSKLKKLDIPFLSNQIQSHFVYNTLNSIQALCYKDPEKAADLIQYFSEYLRLRLDFNRLPELIRIEDEIENVKTYLFIEKQRFGDMINCNYNLKSKGFLIPPLSLQPLVENSIKHGITKKYNGGSINITTYEDKLNYIIEVSDDGVGFDTNNLSTKDTIGTHNLKQRLEINSNGSLIINSIIGKGTCNIIKIPKK